MWLVISGCRKFTAQIALGCADRLSPRLLMPPKVATLLHHQRRKSVWWTFFFFFFIWQLSFATLPRGKQNLMSSLWYCISRKPGLLLPIHLSETIHSSFYLTAPSYALFIIQHSSFPVSSFWTGFSYLLSYVYPFSPPTSPWGYYCITLSHELYSQVESRSNETEGEHFLLSAWLQISSSSQTQAMYLLQHLGIQPRWRTSEIRV